MSETKTPAIQQYLQFRSEFMGYLYAITRDVDLSEEIYQNAAVVVIERSDDSDPILDFRAWAKEVVRRQALKALQDRTRRSSRSKSVSPELLDVVSKVFLEDDVDAVRVVAESRALSRCLEKLPTEKKKLVALRYESGATFEQISSEVHSTASAVQRMLSRIRKRLHGCVQQQMRLAETNS